MRNPWDRLFSAFNYLHASIGINASRDVRWATQYLGGFEDFEAFVLALRSEDTWRKIRRWPHFRPQLDWLCIPGSVELCPSYIGRFETLADDFKHITEELGLHVALSCERKLQSDGQKMFTGKMIEIIGDRYRSDAETLKYSGPTEQR